MDWAYFPVMFDYDGDGDRRTILYQVVRQRLAARAGATWQGQQRRRTVDRRRDNSPLGLRVFVERDGSRCWDSSKRAPTRRDMAAVDRRLTTGGSRIWANDPFDDMVQRFPGANDRRW
jgi:hypothetical protein